LIDREGYPLFPSGSAEPHLHTKRLLEQVSKVIQTMPQNLSIYGHTDAVPYVTERGYSNWELSADRANAARRSLVDFGTPGARVAQVVGKAETEPLVAKNPKDARNRRLAIVMLRGTGADKGKSTGEAPRKLQETLPGLDRIRERQMQGETGQPAAAPQAAPPPPAAAPQRAPAQQQQPRK
jgi:chemotaxis protein MotB